MRIKTHSKFTQAVLSALLGVSIVATAMDLSEAKRSGGGGGAKMHVHKKGGKHAGKRPARPAQLPSNKPSKPQKPGKPGKPQHRPPHHYQKADKWHKHHNYYGRWVAGAATAAAIGTILYSLPSACRVFYSGGVKYWECGGVYYRQRYQGSQVVYVVVARP